MKVKASKFDQEFNAGKDVSRYLDVSRARRPGLEQRRVNVDIPVWMIESLDREAARVGVPRQSLVKLWLAERLERVAAGEPSLRGSVRYIGDITSPAVRAEDWEALDPVRPVTSARQKHPGR